LTGAIKEWEKIKPAMMQAYRDTYSEAELDDFYGDGRERRCDVLQRFTAMVATLCRKLVDSARCFLLECHLRLQAIRNTPTF